MPVIATDLYLHPSSVRSWTDPASNGGRMAATAITCGAEGSVWPAVTSAQRSAGQTQTAKLFWRNANTTDTALDPYVFVSSQPTSGEYIYLRPGTQDGTESQIASNTRRYSAAEIAANVSAGASTITTLLKDASLANCFQVGDHILIYSGGTPGQSGTKWEINQIANITLSGKNQTITLTAATANSYTTAGHVCSLIWGGALSPSYTVVSQSGAGQYDFANNPLTLSAGTVRQRWTLTYTDATTIEVSGDTLGSQGSYPISAAISPPSALGGSYFSLAAAGHGTGHAAGDAIIIDTSPAAIPFWASKVTPSGSAKMPLTWATFGVGCEAG